MQVSVARRVERSRPGEIVACVLLGLGVGTAAGFLLSEVFGTGGHRRMGRLIRRRPHAHTTPAGRAATLLQVRQALATTPALRDEALEVRSRGRALELRGWVAARGLRSLAYRVAREAAGPIELRNHVLVRGEDDGARSEPEPEADAEPAQRSAGAFHSA